MPTSALDALRDALSRNGFRPPRKGGDVHLAIRSLVSEARGVGIPVEQVLILMKREWHMIGSSNGTGHRADGIAVMERLVALCLDEYFSDE